MTDLVKPVSFDQYSIQAGDLDRRRKLIELMQQQLLKPDNPNEMVGQVVVRKSPLEALAKGIQGYFAGKQMTSLKDEQQALGERYNNERSYALGSALQARDGTPERTITPDPQELSQAADQGFEAPQPRTIPASQGSATAMYQALLNSKFPDLQNAGLAGLTKEEAAYTLKPGEIRYQGKNPVASAPRETKYHNVNGQLVPEPTAPGQQVQPVFTAPKFHAVGNNLVPEPTAPGQQVQPAFTAPEKDEVAKFRQTLQAAGIDPDGPQGQALFKSLAVKTATHQPATTVNVSTEKKYGEQFGGLVAKADVDLRDAAGKAPELAERANRVKQALASGKVITGAGADLRLQLGKVMGLAGASDQETITNTETLATQLAQNTLDAIKASGLGSGSGFSNADRDFLEKAVGGKITLEAGTISRLADLSHRAAAQTADRWNKRVKEIPASAIQGTGVSTQPVAVPPLQAGSYGRRSSDKLQRNPDGSFTYRPQ